MKLSRVTAQMIEITEFALPRALVTRSECPLLARREQRGEKRGENARVRQLSAPTQFADTLSDR
ncbi:hypothetical protein P3T25_005679 [Paraburkholderia sp. GAS32]